jgi:hypothetical protein
MQEMISALPVAVSIAGDHYGRQSGISCVNADRHRQCPTMQSIEIIAIQVMRQFCSLTDARHQTYIVRRFFQHGQSAFERFQYLKIRAPRTPLALNIIVKAIFFWH